MNDEQTNKLVDHFTAIASNTSGDVLWGLAKGLVNEALSTNNAEWVERIEKAFKSKYQGAGEAFFPYESLGNCSKQEEIDYIEQEWQELKALITHSKENL